MLLKAWNEKKRNTPDKYILKSDEFLSRLVFITLECILNKTQKESLYVKFFFNVIEIFSILDSGHILNQ